MANVPPEVLEHESGFPNGREHSFKLILSSKYNVRQNLAVEDMLIVLEFQSGSKNTQNPLAVLLERKNIYQNIAFPFNSINKQILTGLVRYGLKPDGKEPYMSFMWVPRLKKRTLDKFTSAINLEKLIRFDRVEIEKTRNILNTNFDLFEPRQISHYIEDYGALGRHILGTQITSEVPMERQLISGSSKDMLTQHSLNILLKPHSSPVGVWFHIEELPMPQNIHERHMNEEQSALKREKVSKDRHFKIGHFDTVMLFIKRRYKHTRDQLEDVENMKDFWHYEIYIRKANLNQLLQDRAIFPIPNFKVSFDSISNPPKSKAKTSELSSVLNLLNSLPFNLVQKPQHVDAVLNGMFASTPKIPRVFPINKQLTSAQYTLQVQLINNVIANDPYYNRFNLFATVNIARLTDEKLIDTDNGHLTSSAFLALKKLKEQLGIYKSLLKTMETGQSDNEARRHKFMSHAVITCSDELLKY